MNDQIKDIGMRLAGLRDDMEISVKEMASKLGVDEKTYEAYESGEKDFSFYDGLRKEALPQKQETNTENKSL